MPRPDSQEITKKVPLGNGLWQQLQQLLSSFRMVVVVQILISGILFVVFVAYAYLTFVLINTRPEPIDMPGGGTVMFDPYSRARDLLILVIPVFTTVVSFWLGLSIQEKRVTQAEAAANDQRIERDTMKQKMDIDHAEMKEKLDKVEALTMRMPETVEAKELRTQIITILEGKQM